MYKHTVRGRWNAQHTHTYTSGREPIHSHIFDTHIRCMLFIHVTDCDAKRPSIIHHTHDGWVYSVLYCICIWRNTCRTYIHIRLCFLYRHISLCLQYSVFVFYTPHTMYHSVPNCGRYNTSKTLHVGLKVIKTYTHASVLYIEYTSTKPNAFGVSFYIFCLSAVVNCERKFFDISFRLLLANYGLQMDTEEIKAVDLIKFKRMKREANSAA